MKIKHTIHLLTILMCTITVFAQQGINYKAIINDAEGNPLANLEVTIQFTILENGTTNVYQETHSTTTDTNGLIILNISEGTTISGDFSAIDWGGNPHFLKTEIDKGEGLTDMGTTEFKTVPYALYSKTSGSVGNNSSITTYSVGDFTQGGIVFWVDETGQHGLVCAKTDQSEGIRWHAGTYGYTQAKGDYLFAGKANTSIIIAAQVAIGDDGSPYAARLCSEFAAITEGKYGDWYLPSKWELYLMYQNKAIIDAIAVVNGGSSFSNAYYWSSSEYPQFPYDYSVAWEINFSNGVQDGGDKAQTRKVRAVRAF